MNPFEQLYSPAQLASFRKVQAALVRDPTALDNRGSVVSSVAAFDQSNQPGNDSGQTSHNSAQ